MRYLPETAEQGALLQSFFHISVPEARHPAITELSNRLLNRRIVETLDGNPAPDCNPEPAQRLRPRAG